MALTLTPGQIPSSCEVAGLRMPAYVPWVCGNSPVTHALEGRIYNTDDNGRGARRIPIRVYLCHPCAAKYKADWKMMRWIDIQPLTKYEFER